MATFEDYVQQMAALARGQSPQLTDLNVGGVYRSILEAVAAQLEMIDAGAADATVSAVGEAAYRLWSFTRMPAVAASGSLRFTATATIPSDITIPAGFLARVPGTDRVYRTLATATFPAGASGSTLDVLIASIGAGVLYNTAAATITEQVAPIADLSVSNPAALSNGADEETDAARAQRFATFVRSIHRATAESLEYAAEQATVTDAGTGAILERVTDARVVDNGAGLATCYIHNGSTAAASSALLAAAAAQVAAYKAAGVTVNTSAAGRSLQTVTCAVRLSGIYSLVLLSTAVTDAISGVFASLAIGDVLYVEQLRHAIMQVPGVIDCTVSLPAANVTPADGTVVVLSGAPTITQL